MGITYKQAAIRLGCDHHMVRRLVREGRLKVEGEEPTNVRGVYRKVLSLESIEKYEATRTVYDPQLHTIHVRLPIELWVALRDNTATPEEKEALLEHLKGGMDETVRHKDYVARVNATGNDDDETADGSDTDNTDDDQEA